MAQNINKQTIVNLLKDKNFEELFISELLWNRPVNTTLPSVVFNGGDYIPKSVAQKNGLEVLECILPKIPTPTECKAIDVYMRRLAKDYIAIYHTSNGSAQVWAAPIKKEERIQVVCINIGDPDKNADYFCPKINMLAFGIEEDDITIIDVKDRVQKAFAVNSEKITKSFYDGFKKEHKSFAAFISGINDSLPADQNKEKQWYASIMLNRLMFCYFIQKKNFLDNNPNYLNDKLKYVIENEGKDKYFSSFYRGFLRRLFSEGLNTPGRASTEFMEKFGNIPYLNGGLFDTHIIETQYTNIEIPDKAFENLFTFFDNWNWCLDTRVTATGHDINPDVLGYIFEQYINDRAQMGAYYTKEDITGYIAKNCIIPFIFDKMKGISAVAKYFRPAGYVWQHLKNSSKTYIYDAMKRGADNWRQSLPPEIADGIDTDKPNLLQRRRLWNNAADPKSALPTETWREAIARHQRCDTIAYLIANGSITDPNALITNNLNILEFAIDIIRNVDMERDYLFIKKFYEILKSVTILDPTCGSGAFLFAALNILEPLYEECIAKMKTAHNRFETELDEINKHYRSNDQYFIFKSIILRNLYGVDIMPEAIEVAKLRLFLKLVAVVDCDPRKENLGLDPLPDIDFNIRCGNTLVGYANEHELEVANYNEDMFTVQDFRDKVAEEMAKISLAYKRYRDIQLNQQKEERIEDFKQSKDELQCRLGVLNTILNKRLHSAKPNILSLDNWTAQTRPFHWIAEFYEIIQNGGFDVIIGNPPYVVYTDSSFAYKVDKTYKTISCSNLYAYCIERSNQLLSDCGLFGMIVPNSIISADKMQPLQKLITTNKQCWISNYSWRPSKLFEGANMLLAIVITCKSTIEKQFSTIYHRWYNEYRASLFECINYEDITNLKRIGTLIKMPNTVVNGILNKMKDKSNDQVLSSSFKQITNNNVLYYFRAVLYWFKVLDRIPIFKEDGIPCTTGEMKPLFFATDKIRNAAIAFLSSSCFFLNYVIWSSCQVVNSRDFYVHFKPENLNDDLLERLSELSQKLQNDFQNNSEVKTRYYKKKGREFTMEKQYFYIKKSKPIIDEIDTLLASHYGFTEEELDFIINYDIKYRMGDELGEE